LQWRGCTWPSLRIEILFWYEINGTNRYEGSFVRSISCLLEALYLKQQYANNLRHLFVRNNLFMFYLEEELDDTGLDEAANKLSLIYSQLLFVINEALSSG
jgi:hypothetical protein